MGLGLPPPPSGAKRSSNNSTPNSGKKDGKKDDGSGGDDGFFAFPAPTTANANANNKTGDDPFFSDFTSTATSNNTIDGGQDNFAKPLDDDFFGDFQSGN